VRGARWSWVRLCAAVACSCALCILCAPVAGAAIPGLQKLHFAAGPYTITPGANLILVDTNQIPKPTVDGYMVRMAPNLHYAKPNGTCCGKIPRVDVIHLHHGVWLSNGAAGGGEGNGFAGVYPFMASGEEKTVYAFPPGYGFPVGAHDTWILNYMIHNLTSKQAKVYITYDIDFVPLTAPGASSIIPVHPIWMDVEARHIYPVFDVLRGSGKHGRYTFPDMDPNAYGGGPPLNEFTIDHPGTLIETAGHVHPGGLYDDLDLIRRGAEPSGGAIAGPVSNSVRLFRSKADYFDPRGDISWDMAMTATGGDWRAAVQAGDTLRVSTTYDSRRASWYESMGIMVVYEAWDDPTGVDPFTHALDQNGRVTHGHLAENNNHGGAKSRIPNPIKLRSCRTSRVLIGGFQFLPGDLAASGSERCAPTVTQGHSITFVNDDAAANAIWSLFSPNRAYMSSIFHSITACAGPCNASTGISYPLANGAGGYDSAQLGFGMPAAGSLDWSTPSNLKPGTYTFFCRIHPFMRGVFRIVR